MRNQVILIALICLFVLGGGRQAKPAAGATADSGAETIQVDINPQHAIQTFRPDRALGSTVDKEPAGSIPSLYSRSNIREMLAPGYGWLSYRLFTELSVQDWHWNPAGRFSAGREGYWTSSAARSSPLVTDSYGYRLPHRGFTSDQGNNEDYSRLDDGDVRTFWKSDPYLTHAYTGDPDGEHAQWVVVDLDTAQPIDAMRIAWSDPYATDYAIQYWTGDDAIGDPGVGSWRDFPLGRRAHARGKTVTVRLTAVAVKARFVRILMTTSSGTCDVHGRTDRRNCMGYAIAEIGAGMLDRRGGLHDIIQHARCGGEKPGIYRCGRRQTATYVSSVDPWHAAGDRVRNQEQPGLDLIARSGLTRGLPAMYPVPMLYSTPENAVAEIRYLAARGYPLQSVELGEEPDGQYTTPEDYGALYVQWAKALHAAFPHLQLGGPVFSGVNSELQAWPDAHDNISWMNRFLEFLRSHNAMDALAFVSFEHYPFGGCEHGLALQRDLLHEPSIMRGIVNTWHADGVPASLPLYVTEANFSAVNFTQVPMQIEGALWQAEYMASALAAGVRGVVYYQYEPVPLSRNRDCLGDWGNLTMFVADRHGRIRARAAQFFAGEMLMQHWLMPGDAPHVLHPARSNVTREGLPLISAYAVERPDKTWSIMLINKDGRAHDVRVQFVDPDLGAATGFAGKVTRITFGSAQYEWHRRGAASQPEPAAEPVTSQLDAIYQGPFQVPAQSITVLRGALGPTGPRAQ